MATSTETTPKASPARGQAWRRSRVPGGTLFFVMAVADGYVLARYKGCSPFVMSIRELQTSCTRMESFDRNMGRPS